MQKPLRRQTQGAERENTMDVFVKKALSAECGRSRRRRLRGRFGLDAIASRFFEAGKG